MSSSRIFSQLNPSRSLVSTLVFLSQFQSVNAKDKEDSSINFMFIPIVFAWGLCFLICYSNTENPAPQQQPQPAIEITPIMRPGNNAINNYSTLPEEASVTSEEVAALPEENSSAIRFMV
jgi:hypothetical protein